MSNAHSYRSAGKSPQNPVPENHRPRADSHVKHDGEYQAPPKETLLTENRIPLEDEPPAWTVGQSRKHEMFTLETETE